MNDGNSAEFGEKIENLFENETRKGIFLLKHIITNIFMLTTCVKLPR